jgi:hypothetical protein
MLIIPVPVSHHRNEQLVWIAPLPVRCLTLFVGICQDYLASLLLLPLIILILVRATLMQLLWPPYFQIGHNCSYTQLTSLPADSVGPGPGNPAAPVLAIPS